MSAVLFTATRLNLIDVYKRQAEDLGRIKITKQSAASSQDKLKGVKFNVINTQGKTVDTITTGSDGTATTKFLPVGTYTLKELTPVSYTHLPLKWSHFTITNHCKKGLDIYETCWN